MRSWNDYENSEAYSGGQNPKAQEKLHIAAYFPSAIPATQRGTGGAVGRGAEQVVPAGMILHTSGHVA